MGSVKEGTAGGKARPQIKVICKDRDEAKQKKRDVARGKVREKDRNVERTNSGTEEDKQSEKK